MCCGALLFHVPAAAEPRPAARPAALVARPCLAQWLSQRPSLLRAPVLTQPPSYKLAQHGDGQHETYIEPVKGCGWLLLRICLRTLLLWRLPLPPGQQQQGLNRLFSMQMLDQQCDYGQACPLKPTCRLYVARRCRHTKRVPRAQVYQLASKKETIVAAFIPGAGSAASGSSNPGSSGSSSSNPGSSGGVRWTLVHSHGNAVDLGEGTTAAG